MTSEFEISTLRAQIDRREAVIAEIDALGRQEPPAGAFAFETPAYLLNWASQMIAHIAPPAVADETCVTPTSRMTYRDHALLILAAAYPGLPPAAAAIAERERSRLRMDLTTLRARLERSDA